MAKQQATATSCSLVGSRIVKDREHREGLEPSSPHYGCGVLATGRPVQCFSVGPEGLAPTPAGLKVRYAAVTPQPRYSVGGMRFNRRASNMFFSPSVIQFASGSPENRTQHYAVISRVWATSPRLPLVVQVGKVGLEVHDPCSQNTLTLPLPYIPLKSERSDGNRRSRGPQPRRARYQVSATFCLTPISAPPRSRTSSDRFEICRAIRYTCRARGPANSGPSSCTKKSPMSL